MDLPTLPQVTAYLIDDMKYRCEKSTLSPPSHITVTPSVRMAINRAVAAVHFPALNLDWTLTVSPQRPLRVQVTRPYRASDMGVGDPSRRRGGEAED